MNLNSYVKFYVQSIYAVCILFVFQIVLMANLFALLWIFCCQYIIIIKCSIVFYNFQTKSNSKLAVLHNKDPSVMERHHISQAIAIIELEGCNILDNLTPSEYSKFLEHMEHVIMGMY